MYIFKKSIGNRIKELRKERGFTQEYLSELAGISTKSISKLECGQSFPTRCFDNIINALNISAEEFLQYEDLEIDYDQKIDFIIKVIKTIPPDKIEYWYKLAKVWYH